MSNDRDDGGRFLPGSNGRDGNAGIKTQRLTHYRRDLVERLNELQYDVIEDIVNTIRDPNTPREWANRLRIALLGKAVPSFAAIQHVRTGKTEHTIRIEAALVANPAAAALAEQAVFKALGLDKPKALLPAPGDTGVIDAEVISDGTDNDEGRSQSQSQPE
jgi:hypothetical protein